MYFKELHWNAVSELYYGECMLAPPMLQLGHNSDSRFYYFKRFKAWIRKIISKLRLTQKNTMLIKKSVCLFVCVCVFFFFGFFVCWKRVIFSRQSYSMENDIVIVWKNGVPGVFFLTPLNMPLVKLTKTTFKRNPYPFPQLLRRNDSK